MAEVKSSCCATREEACNFFYWPWKEDVAGPHTKNKQDEDKEGWRSDLI